MLVSGCAASLVRGSLNAVMQTWRLRSAGGEILHGLGGQRLAADAPLAATSTSEIFTQVTSRMFSPSIATMASVNL